MDFKLLKLKSNLHWSLLTGGIRKLEYPVETPVEDNCFHSGVICFPADEEYFRLAMFTFKDALEDADIRANFSMLIAQKYRPLFHYSLQNAIFYEPEKISELPHIPTVDLLINLNPGFDLELARWISHVRAPYKIGFKSQFSDHFYNIQYDSEKTTILERIYIQLRGMLNR